MLKITDYETIHTYTVLVNALDVKIQLHLLLLLFTYVIVYSVTTPVSPSTLARQSN